MANGVNERRWLTVIFCLYFLLAVGYSLLMPIWEAPDEGAHFHLAWYLARKDQYAPEEKNYEAAQPRGYYYFGSVIIRALDKINPDFSDYTYPREFKYNIRIPERRFDWNAENYRFLLGVYMLRWVNILFGALALWLNWKAFKLIVPGSPWMRMAALALTALTPQYLHIMSSVNNDALGTVAGALLFYLVIQIVRSQERSNDLSRSAQPSNSVTSTSRLKNVSLSDSEGSLRPKVRDSSVAKNAPSERHGIFEMISTNNKSFFANA